MNKNHNFATDNRDGYIVHENVPETNVRKINGRTPDEIKKGMTCCLTRWEVDHLASCHTDCPYRSEGIWCRNVLMADIKAWNKQLESRLAQVAMERDAAVIAILNAQHYIKDLGAVNYGLQQLEKWDCYIKQIGACEENTKDGKEGKA